MKNYTYKKKYIFILLSLLVIIPLLIFLFYKNKKIEYISKDADAYLIVDIKKVRNHYIKNIILHPSQWNTTTDSQKEKDISWLNNGLKIPYFLQLFHLPNQPAWYSFFELNDYNLFINFLKQEQFSNTSINTWINNNFCIYINPIDKKCLISYNSSPSVLKHIYQKVVQKKEIKNIEKSNLSTYSYLAFNKIQGYIHIDNTSINCLSKGLNPTTHTQKKSTNILSLNINSEFIKKIYPTLNPQLNIKALLDSTHINKLRIDINKLVEENDTIIKYEYDDNFNEVKKIAIQKIVQPKYGIHLYTTSPNHCWDYLQKKNWINPKNEFINIPIIDNKARKEKTKIVIGNYSIQNNITENNLIYHKNKQFIEQINKYIPHKQKNILNLIENIYFIETQDSIYLNIDTSTTKLPWILALMK